METFLVFLSIISTCFVVLHFLKVLKENITSSSVYLEIKKLFQILRNLLGSQNDAKHYNRKNKKNGARNFKPKHYYNGYYHYYKKNTDQSQHVNTENLFSRFCSWAEPYIISGTNKLFAVSWIGTKAGVILFWSGLKHVCLKISEKLFSADVHDGGFSRRPYIHFASESANGRTLPDLTTLWKGFEQILGVVWKGALLYGCQVLCAAETHLRKLWEQVTGQKVSTVYSFCEKLEDNFNNLTQLITPSPQFTQEAGEARNRILETLKQNSGRYDLAIGKTKPAGSLAKNSAIMYRTRDGICHEPDSDLVVNVNNVYPEFAQVYKNFEKILEQMPEVSNIKIRKYSMSFTYRLPTQGNINVDLLAATNRVIDTTGCENVAAEEAKRALSRIGAEQWKSIRETGRVDMEPNRLHSSSLAIQTVDVIKEHLREPSVLAVVKLAKLWCGLVEYPQGPGRNLPRSCMIEIIAICAQEEHNENTSVVDGFVKFLEAITGLDKLVMDIKQGRKLEWDYTTPMIVDPVNRFNNLAEGLHSDCIQTLMEKAKATLAIIRNLTQGSSYERSVNPIAEIFGRNACEIQP